MQGSSRHIVKELVENLTVNNRFSMRTRTRSLRCKGREVLQVFFWSLLARYVLYLVCGCNCPLSLSVRVARAWWETSWSSSKREGRFARLCFLHFFCAYPLSGLRGCFAV